MTNETFIKAQLAALAHREAAHLGGIDNMLAVAFVIRNRQRAGWRGGNWLELIQHAHEAAGTIYPQSVPDLRDILFKLVLQQVDDIYSGLAVDKFTEGALYYAELNRIDRQDFLEQIVRDPQSHPRVAIVGNVTFFK